jgi:O-antigen/teichoic acid export membrane protein
MSIDTLTAPRSESITGAAATAEGVPEAVPALGARLLRASALVTVGNVASRVVSLLAGIVCARLLTETQFGAFGVIQSTLGMFATGAGLALGMAATRYLAMYRATDPDRVPAVLMVVFGVGTGSTAAMALVLVLLAPWLSSYVLHDPALAWPLRWSALQLVTSTAYGIVAGVLSGMERYGVIGVTAVLQNVAIVLASILLIPLGGLNGAIAAQAVGLGLATIVSLWYVRGLITQLHGRRLFDDLRRERAMLVNFCFPSLLGSLVILPATWAATVVLANAPNGLTEVAYFTAADRFRQMLVFVAGFVGTALLPILAGTTSDASGAGARRTLELGITGTGILVLPLAALLAFGGPAVMAMFGRSYEANWAVLLPIVAWGTAGAIGGILGTALLAHGRLWFQLLQQATYGLTVLSVTYALRVMGAPALALAHLIAVLVLAAWTMPYVYRLGILSSRAARQMLGVTAGGCLLCIASWLCPPGWRLPAAAPVTLLTFGVAATMLAPHERVRVWHLAQGALKPR